MLNCLVYWRRCAADLDSGRCAPRDKAGHGESEMGFHITGDEVAEVVKNLFGGRAPGLDKSRAMFLKALNVVGLTNSISSTASLRVHGRLSNRSTCVLWTLRRHYPGVWGVGPPDAGHLLPVWPVSEFGDMQNSMRHALKPSARSSITHSLCVWSGFLGFFGQRISSWALRTCPHLSDWPALYFVSILPTGLEFWRFWILVLLLGPFPVFWGIPQGPFDTGLWNFTQTTYSSECTFWYMGQPCAPTTKSTSVMLGPQTR